MEGKRIDLIKFLSYALERNVKLKPVILVRYFKSDSNEVFINSLIPNCFIWITAPHSSLIWFCSRSHCNYLGQVSLIAWVLWSPSVTRGIALVTTAPLLSPEDSAHELLCLVAHPDGSGVLSFPVSVWRTGRRWGGWLAGPVGRSLVNQDDALLAVCGCLSDVDVQSKAQPAWPEALVPVLRAQLHLCFSSLAPFRGLEFSLFLLVSCWFIFICFSTFSLLLFSHLSCTLMSNIFLLSRKKCH